MFDSQRIIRETQICHVEQHRTLDSTNLLAIELLPDLLKLAPALVITPRQTAGRGRGTNKWAATEGALTFTLVLDSEALSIESSKIAMVALAVGFAVRNQVATAANASATVKWPNDVLIDERKICGILCEQRMVDDQSGLIVGIGINVNNSIATAPAEIRQTATSLYDLTQKSVELDTTLVDVIKEVFIQLETLRDHSKEFVKNLNQVSFLNGKFVTIDRGGESIAGRCDKIGDHGSLIVRSIDGQSVHQINSGTIESWHSLS